MPDVETLPACLPLPQPGYGPDSASFQVMHMEKDGPPNILQVDDGAGYRPGALEGLFQRAAR